VTPYTCHQKQDAHVCQGGWLFLKDRQRMNHTIHAANAYLHTKGGRTINLTSNGTCGNSQDNLPNKRNLRWVAALVDFIINPRMLKHKTRVILTLEMAQAFNTSKSQTIFIFLMLVIFTLHQTCPSYLLSMPYICLEAPLACELGETQTSNLIRRKFIASTLIVL